MSEKEIVDAALALLCNIPFGCVDGRIVTCRGTSEFELCEWVAQAHDLKSRIQLSQQGTR